LEKQRKGNKFKAGHTIQGDCQAADDPGKSRRILQGEPIRNNEKVDDIHNLHHGW